MCKPAFSDQAGAGSRSLGSYSAPPSASCSPRTLLRTRNWPCTHHTCLESPFWICLKLLLLQGWDVLGPPKSTSAPSITTPNEVPSAPELDVQSHIHHGHWAVSTTTRPLKGLNPEWIYPRGTLLCFYVFNSLDFSVSSINQGRTLFLHTREWGRHTGNRQKTHGGRDMTDSDYITPIFIPLCFLFFNF